MKWREQIERGLAPVAGAAKSSRAGKRFARPEERIKKSGRKRVMAALFRLTPEVESELRDVFEFIAADHEDFAFVMPWSPARHAGQRCGNGSATTITKKIFADPEPPQHGTTHVLKGGGFLSDVKNTIYSTHAAGPATASTSASASSAIDPFHRP